MSKKPKGVAGPLAFSAVLGVVAGIAVMVFSTGGGTRELRVDLGLTAGGIAFIASLVISAMLLMTEKPNDDQLGKGSGVNRSSAAPRTGSAERGDHRTPRRNNDDDGR